MSERDRALLDQLRKVIEKSNQFIETAEAGTIEELKFAEGLGVLMRLHWDVADEMSARASALYATNQWRSFAQQGPLKAPGSD